MLVVIMNITFSKKIFKQNLHKATNRSCNSLGEMRVYVRSPFEPRRCRLTNRWPKYKGDVTWESSKPHSSVWKCCWNHHQKVSRCLKSFIIGRLYVFQIRRSYLFIYFSICLTIKIFIGLMHNFVVILFLYDNNVLWKKIF